MTRVRSLATLALVSLAACDGLKEAFSSHVDVAAQAGSQELSVQTLADLLGKSRVPVRKEVAQSIAETWVNYQLLGIAAANAVLDVIEDEKLCDRANQLGSRLKQHLEMLRAEVPEIVDIRGPGFMNAVEFNDARTGTNDGALLMQHTRFINADGDLRTHPGHWPEIGGLDGFYAARLLRS